MIIGKNTELSLYSGISKGFSDAVKWFAAADINALPSGKTAIDGDRIYCMRVSRALDAENETWEAHLKYADVQIVLEGAERFGCALAGLAPREKYDADADFLPCEAPEGFDVMLRAGEFAVFFPGEPHRPNNPARAGDICDKLILKIRMEDM